MVSGLRLLVQHTFAAASLAAAAFISAIAVPPLSGYWAIIHTLEGKVRALKAFFVSLVISGLPLLLFWAICAILISVARKAGRLAFEADTAMGIGIDFLLCMLVFLLTNLAVLICLLAVSFLRKNKTESLRG